MNEYVYLVEYDLIKDKDYSELIKAIKSYTHTKLLLSSWFVKTTKGAGDLRDELKKHLDSDDKIVIIELQRHWATQNISKTTTDWLKDNLK